MKRSLGFTLIELMVVITIIITSGVLVLPRLAQFRASSEIEEEASRMLASVKQAQTNAISGAQCGEQFTPTFKAVNWKFISGSTNYSVEPTCTQGFGAPVSTFNLKAGVTVSKIAYDNGTRSNAAVDVTSMPNGGPGSYVSFKNISGAANFVDGSALNVLNYNRMIVVLQSSSSRAGVFIEKGGLIYTGAVR